MGQPAHPHVGVTQSSTNNKVAPAVFRSLGNRTPYISTCRGGVRDRRHGGHSLMGPVGAGNPSGAAGGGGRRAKLARTLCNAHANLIHPHVHCTSVFLPAMLRAEELASLRSLAERLEVQLRRAGPTTGVPKIMAAILIARGEHGARAACRMIPGVPDDGAHSFVGKLARRVRMLLSTTATSSAADSSTAS